MSIWDWVYEHAAEAEAKGDVQRQRLLELTHQASEYGKEEPDLHQATLNEGRALAVQLQEPWWVLFFDHWRLQGLLHYKRDYREVLDIGVAAALEARKPIYAQFPQRICLHEDLITAYLGIDPLGHAKLIEQAMDYMDQEMPENVECRFCAEGCRTDFAMSCDDLEGAEKSARRTLEMADDYWNASTADHHAGAATGHLCKVAYRKQDWQSLQQWAELGEELNRKDEDPLGLGVHLLWQAFLARNVGDEELGKRLRRRAVSRIKRLQSVPSGDAYDALCAYYERGGEIEKSLQARERELARISGMGRFHDECQCRLKKCRLLAQMGKLTEEDREGVRQAAAQLRNPAPILEELESISTGG